MADASTPDTMSTGLMRVAERAKREPEARFHSIAHLIDEQALLRSYGRLRNDAAVGVDGVTKEEYEEHLMGNLRALHGRLRAGTYRHQPIRRVHIPKDRGRTRPIGVSAVEDKIVQGALRELLEAVYEQDFHECSFGFRPGRGAHDAIRTLYAAISRGRMKWILEADIVSFFDSVDRAHLSELLQIRVPDGSVQRLVGKCLHVGVMDGEEFSTPDTGTTQGSVLSPLLGNVYLHYVLDLWFARDVKPRLTGEAVLVRYADDFVIAFETEEDAKRVYAALPKRLAKYGLQLHGEKTRLLPFSRPPWRATKGVATFDFLGFTWFWRKTRRNRWTVGCKTRSARLTRAIKAVNDWCRSHRHLAVKEQHSALVRRLRGHFNYFGVNGNMRSLEQVVQQVRRIWFKWLNRRSQRRSFTWEVFDEQLLAAFPLPVPRITVQIWGE